MSFVAKVKNVLSPDTLVLIPSKSNQVPVPERILTLSYVRGDSYAAKEQLRALLIGKDVKFKVLYKTPSGKEFGDIQTPIFQSLIEYGLEKGWFKLREGLQDDSEYVEDVLRPLENKGKDAIAASEKDPKIIEVDEDIIAKSQRAPITTVIEKVISGDRVMARIIINKGQHIVTPLLLAGLKAPRTDDATQSASLTKVAHQAKEFVEQKLLTTTAALKVQLVGLSQTGVPIGLIVHPSGNNIHEKLLEYGYGEIADWQSGLIGSSQMSSFRKAEQTAKALAKGIFQGNAGATKVAAATSGNVGAKGVGLKSLRVGSSIDSVTIAKVISADTLTLRLPNDEEFTVQLASVRAPRQNDSQLSSNPQERTAIINSAKEYVRHLAAGKTGSVYIDGQRAANPDLGFEERFLVTIKLSGGKDLSETIIQAGWATVIKHNKATSHERSMNWDKLVELEQEQTKAGKKGVYFTGPDKSKIITVNSRIVDASENLTKAKTFFNGFKQKGRISAGYYVEFIPSMNRFKLYNPKEGLKLTLILGGLTNSKDEQLSEEGLKFMNKRFLQKNVEFEIYDQDKIGGFIGNVFATAKSLSPVQVQLLEQGLIKTHEIAINQNSFGAQLKKAEELAQLQKKGIWTGYSPEDNQAAQEVTSSISQLSIKPKFFDIEVTEIDEEGVINFQILDPQSKAQIDSFKRAFSDFNAQIPSASQTSVDLPHNLTKPPKKGELVSAKYSETGKYYRARVVSFEKLSGKYAVKHIDFGNVDLVPLSHLRTLPSKFNISQFPIFAHTCVLQNLRLPPSKPTDYRTEALYALEDLCYDRKLVVSCVPSKLPNVEYDAVLFDSEKSLKDSSYTINKQLVKEGWAVVDVRKINAASKEYDTEILAVQKSARAGHRGCWEFGDVQFDEDLE